MEKNSFVASSVGVITCGAIGAFLDSVDFPGTVEGVFTMIVANIAAISVISTVALSTNAHPAFYVAAGGFLLLAQKKNSENLSNLLKYAISPGPHIVIPQGEHRPTGASEGLFNISQK